MLDMSKTLKLFEDGSLVCCNINGTVEGTAVKLDEFDGLGLSNEKPIDDVGELSKNAPNQEDETTFLKFIYPRSKEETSFLKRDVDKAASQL
jgi:hypothetical protein